MGRKLAQNVYLRDPEGRSLFLAKDSEPTPEQAALISNPLVWADEEPAPGPDPAEAARLEQERAAAEAAEAQRVADEAAAAETARLAEQEAAEAAEAQRIADEQAAAEAAKTGGKTKPAKQ